MILVSYSHFNCFKYPFSIVKVQLFIDKTVCFKFCRIFLTSSGFSLGMSGNSFTVVQLDLIQALWTSLCPNC